MELREWVGGRAPDWRSLLSETATRLLPLRQHPHPKQPGSPSQSGRVNGCAVLHCAAAQRVNTLGPLRPDGSWGPAWFRRPGRFTARLVTDPTALQDFLFDRPGTGGVPQRPAIQFMTSHGVAGSWSVPRYSGSGRSSRIRWSSTPAQSSRWTGPKVNLSALRGYESGVPPRLRRVHRTACFPRLLKDRRVTKRCCGQFRSDYDLMHLLEYGLDKFITLRRRRMTPHHEGSTLVTP